MAMAEHAPISSKSYGVSGTREEREERERDSVDIFCETSTGHGNETHSSLDVGGSWMLAIFVLYLRILTKDGALEIADCFP